MTRLEVRLPSPHSDHQIPLALDQLGSGASAACPGGGRAVTFRGGGAETVRQPLDLRGDRGAQLRVNLTVKRKS